jgi:hypothetical protein
MSPVQKRRSRKKLRLRLLYHMYCFFTMNQFYWIETRELTTKGHVFFGLFTKLSSIFSDHIDAKIMQSVYWSNARIWRRLRLFCRPRPMTVCSTRTLTTSSPSWTRAKNLWLMNASNTSCSRNSAKLMSR